MPLSFADARTRVRAVTAHDTDTQITDSQLDAWLTDETARVRRDLIAVAPQLYQKLSDTFPLTITPYLDLSAITDFERVWRVDVLDGSTWRDVPVSDEASPELGDLTYRETTAGGIPALLFSPSTAALGNSFRVAYHAAPAASSVEVPSGMEDAVLMRVAAKVAMRCFDDPRAFNEEADRVWATQRRAVRRRYGAQPQPGLRLTKGW